MIENIEGIALESAARTATASSATILNTQGKDIDVTLVVTAASATPSVVLTIDYYDVASGTWINLLTGAAVTGISSNRYRVGPTLTAAANLVAQAQVPRQIRIVVTHADADSITYSVGYRIGIN